MGGLTREPDVVWKSLLGEGVASEWGLARLGRVQLKCQQPLGQGTHPAGWGACTSGAAGGPGRAWNRQDARVRLPVPGRVGAGGFGGTWPGPAASPWVLLLQVPSWAMDMNVLMSAQLLMEQVAAEGSGPLLYLLYQHVLFTFRLWSPSDFAVRLGGCGDSGGATPPGRVGAEILRS